MTTFQTNWQKIRTGLSVGMCGLVFATPLFAADPFDFTTNQQRAMGGTGIATARGANALFMNPAGLVNSGFQMSLPTHIRVDANDDILNHLSDLQALPKADRPISKVSALAPLTLSAKAYVSPAFSFILPGLGFSIFAGGDAFARLVHPGQPYLDNIQGKADIVPSLGYAQPLTVFGKEINVGAAVHYVYRTRLTNGNGDLVFTKQTTEIVNGDEFILKANTMTLTGFSGDLGMTMPVGPGQLGVVYNNIGGALTGKAPSGNSVTETLPAYLGVGYSQEVDATPFPYLGPWIGTFRGSADVRFIYNDLYKNLFVGVEKKFLGDVLALRMGLNQGYPAVGLGVDLAIFQLNYAYYCEEKGAKVGDMPVAFHSLELGFFF